VPKSAVKVGDRYVFNHITSKNHQIIKERVIKEITDEDDNKIEKNGKVMSLNILTNPNHPARFTSSQ
jgi:hypothetical protein